MKKEYKSPTTILQTTFNIIIILSIISLWVLVLGDRKIIFDNFDHDGKNQTESNLKIQEAEDKINSLEQRVRKLIKSLCAFKITIIKENL